MSGISAPMGGYAAYISGQPPSEQLSSEKNVSDSSLTAGLEEDITKFFKSSGQPQALKLNRDTQQVKITRSRCEAKRMDAIVGQAIERLSAMPSNAYETAVTSTPINNIDAINKQHEILQVDKKAQEAGAALVRFLKNKKRNVEAVIVKTILSAIVTPYPILNDKAEFEKKTIEYNKSLNSFQDEMAMFFKFFIEKLPDNEKIKSKKLYVDMMKYYKDGRKMRKQLIGLITFSANDHGMGQSQQNNNNTFASDFFSLLAGYVPNLLSSTYT
jgi:hypothetical protein